MKYRGESAKIESFISEICIMHPCVFQGKRIRKFLAFVTEKYITAFPDGIYQKLAVFDPFRNFRILFVNKNRMFLCPGVPKIPVFISHHMVLSECIFPSATVQATISQVATAQMCNFPSGNFPKVRIGLLRRCRLQWGPSAAAMMGLGTERYD